jgi:hypothetical protein
MMQCDKYNKGREIMTNEIQKCLRTESFCGIISCIITFLVASAILLTYPIDPIDCNLIINE